MIRLFKLVRRQILKRILAKPNISCKGEIYNTLSGAVHLIGKPLIQIGKDATLIIGNNVSLNSLNRSYHVNMFAPIKLLAYRPLSRIVIGDNTRIHGSCIHAADSIEIGSNCLIAANC